MVPVFLVSLGDESSALMSGLDVLGLEPIAWLSLGSSAASGRCARNCWPMCAWRQAEVSDVPDLELEKWGR